MQSIIEDVIFTDELTHSNKSNPNGANLLLQAGLWLWALSWVAFQTRAIFLFGLQKPLLRGLSQCLMPFLFRLAAVGINWRILDPFAQ